MKLSELISVLPFVNDVNMYDEIEVKQIETDSREVKPGSLFICLRGLQTDGHLFIEQAVDNGAIAVITEKPFPINIPQIIVTDTTSALAKLVNKFYDYPTSKFSLIGVTGTNGKTTVSYLLEAIYQTLGKKTGVIGTIHNKIGNEVFNTNHTTPDALSLQRIFNKMGKENVEQAIMEVSSHALDMGRVHGCEFNTVVFTNFSQDHLDYHEHELHYFYAKSLLFSQLGNSYQGKPKYAVINADDAYAKQLKKTTAQTILTYGLKNNADITAVDVQQFPHQTIFRLKTPLGTVKITSRLIGEFNIYNMLAASSAAIANRVPLQVIQQAFQNIPGIPGRFETVDAGQDYAVVVDYAHTPDALENILMTGRKLSRGKLITVVGCGGNRDRTKREVMAKTALEYANLSIFTADNPRDEDPNDIVLDMISGLDSSVSNYRIEIDRELAIRLAIKEAEKGDMVIIAGKGHETYQEIAGVKYPFDDRAVVRNVIRA